MALALLTGGSGLQAQQQAPLRKIGELELAIRGLTATTDATQTLPKNVASGVRITIRAGGQELNADDAARFLGGAFAIAGELSGPGLPETQSLRSATSGGTSSADPFLLPLPALSTSGDYTLANLRVVRPITDGDGHTTDRTVLDVTPPIVALDVIDQILITSVTTRPLTLDEIKARGIVLTSDDYTGFEFTIGMKLESKPVTISFPAVFDRQNIAVPQPLVPPTVSRTDVPVPQFVPLLLQADLPAGEPNGKRPPLTMDGGGEVTIPSVLVIPGNVGYLHQFFSAQLFVANGAPVGTALTVHDVTGTVKLPQSPDGDPARDPLKLAQTETGVHPTLPVRGLGVDGQPGTADDVDTLHAGEQGQAEFLIRGDKEGYYPVSFDIHAKLDGLPVGPVSVSGTATGGVLVRNPYYDMTFTLPSVVRADEPFTMYATVTNIGQGIGNDISITLDAAALANVRPGGDLTQHIATLMPGDAATVQFRLIPEKTGQAVATYLSFDGENVSGRLRFKVGVGERGVPLSPDTLVLPSVTDALPGDVIRAAMRVLGQAYSAANAPAGTLPAGVIRPGKDVITQKALALAEAGLRITLGQTTEDALRDLGADFYLGLPSGSSANNGGATLPTTRFDGGFDQILRETDAGYALARALGSALVPAMTTAGGPLGFERAVAQVQASGADFASVGVDAAAVDVALTNAAGATSVAGRTADRPASAAPGVGFIPLGASADAPVLGLITSLTGSPYTLTLSGRAAGATAVSVTLPRGDGTFVRGSINGITVTPAWRGRVIVDLTQPDHLTLDQDTNGDGTFDTPVALGTEILQAQGARLLSANVVGPETLDGAGPWGLHAVLVFDRMVDAASAAAKANYQIPSNGVVGAKAVMSQRVVMMSLEQPEGPFVPTTLTANGIDDGRGVAGPGVTVPLGSRLRDPGAIVSGHVFNADGTPVAGGTILYEQNPDILLCNPTGGFIAFSRVVLDASGRYELRYVRKDSCGFPFTILTKDPATGATASVSRYVRSTDLLGDPERIVADLALLGRGNVTGFVRDLQGHPVAGANVAVASETDHQVGGTAITDGDGKYTINNVTVGVITVRAVKDTSEGHSGGRIDRAGTTARVDITLDGGTVNVSGSVMTLNGATRTPAPNVIVAYRLGSQSVGFTTTDAAGHYVLAGMPTGAYTIEAIVDVYTRASITGTAAAGDTLTRDILIPLPETGTIQGLVQLPSGQPATQAYVNAAGRAVTTGPDGRFVLSGIPLGQNIQVGAVTFDETRSAGASVDLNQAGQHVDVTMVLSGLGQATFTVLGPDGNAAPNVLVLRRDCSDACGCGGTNTDANGRVTFTKVRVGQLFARAFTYGAVIDTADGVASVTRDAENANGIIRLKGLGSVTGLVLAEDGSPVFGVDVEVSSNHFVNDGLMCQVTGGVSHHVRTDNDGKFRIPSVNIGFVGVRASGPFAPTPVGAQDTITHAGDTVNFTLRLVDTTAGVLSGTVFLPDGVTPAGAGVQVTTNGVLPDTTVLTDSAGHYRFAKIFPEGYYTLTASDPVSGGRQRQAIYLHAKQDAQHDLRLKGRGSVRVTVVDAANNQVSDAYVRLTETDFPSSTYERAISPANNGVATFQRVFEGPISIEVSDAFSRGGRISSSVPGEGATVDVTVRLSATGSITGHVVMPDRTTAIPFATVNLIAGGRVIGQMTTDGSADVGAFSFDYVPAGPFRLEALDPATARTGVAVGTIETEGQAVTVDVIAQALGTVKGMVTSNGDPQPGALVTLQSGSFKVDTITDATGQYLVRGVPEGPVSATAALDAGGFLRGSASATLSGEGTELVLNVALRSSGAVTGFLQTWNGLTPPASIVTIEAAGTGGGRQQTVTQPDGSFAFARVPAGPATLGASVLDGVDQGRATVTVPNDDTASVTMRLNGVGIAQVHALDSSGADVVGRITIAAAPAAAFPYSRTATTGTNGLATIPDLLAGPVNVQLIVNNGTTTLYGTVTATINPGDTNPITVQLQPSGVITGRVLRADGVTAAIGTEIRLVSPGLSVTVTADQDGYFEARGVPLGSVTLNLHDGLSNGFAVVPSLNLATNGQTIDTGTIVLDDSAVHVISVDPADGATNQPITQAVRLTFSDQLQSAAGIFARQNGQVVNAGVVLSGDGKTVTITPQFPGWIDDSDVEVNGTTAVTDIFGRHPAQAFISHFRTTDVSPPRVTATTPVNGAIQIAPQTTIAITFSETLSATTDLNMLVTVTGPSGAIAGSTASTGPATVVFTPAAALAQNALYTVSVNGAVDISGNQQTQVSSFVFATPDTVVPALTLIAPSPNGVWITNKRPLINIGVVDAVSGPDFSTRGLQLGAADVSAATVSTPTTIQYVPPADLVDGVYPIGAHIADRAGNVGTLSASFGVDTLAPTAAQITGLTANQVLIGTVTFGAIASDATSGVALIDILVDGMPRLQVTGPSFTTAYDSRLLPDGPHTLTARATDLAGNVGPVGPPLDIAIDNNNLTLTITSPAAQSRFRDNVTVTATVSEVVQRVEFALGDALVVDTSSPYSATLPLTAIPDGTVNVIVTAYGSNNNASTARVAIVVDRTPPNPPDATVINAEPPAQGFSLVYGRQAAVEANARVEITNTVTGGHVTTLAAADGSFTASIGGVVGQQLSLVAIDDLGNRSTATLITIRDTPSLPVGQGTTSLHFEGVLADRVGTGRELTADGLNDAVFTVSIAIGDGVTRRLSYIDLAGPQMRSTRTAVSAVVGVASDPGSNFLNGADGQVAFPVTTGATLTLFASDAGFIVPGATYVVTVAFTDGSRFVADTTIVAPEDRPQIARSLVIAANPATVTIAPGQPGTSTLTLTDIRDVDGALVPDGAKVAIAATDMASKDPRGNALRSAGGAIVDGTVAANNASFHVFTVTGGHVVATYQSDPVTPAPLTGAAAVVQVMPADAAGNVLGTEAIGTFNLNLRASTDQAVVMVDAGSLYADTGDRRTHVHILLRDVNGQPLPDGTKVVVTAINCATTYPTNACISSAGGTIVGGTASPSGGGFRVLTVVGGAVDVDYSATGLQVGASGTAIGRIQVAPANANGAVASSFAMGTGDVALVGAGRAELIPAPDSLPLVSFPRTSQVRVRDIRDARANRVPDGVVFVLSAQNCAATFANNSCVFSAGGSIIDGLQSPSGTAFRQFPVTQGEIGATYSTGSLAGTPGQVQTATAQLMSARPDGVVISSLEVGLTPIRLISPLQAAGTASPMAIMADAGLHTSTITFFPVLDADGNALPDGSKVVVSAANCAGTFPNNSCINSAGGQIVGGDPSPSASSFRVFTVSGGAVTFTYADQDLAVGPGQQATANVVLMEANGSGAAISSVALGIAPVTLVGLTSATAAVNPGVIHADGADRRVAVTITDLKDALGRPVPDGTMVDVTAGNCIMTFPNNSCIFSAGGTIIGGSAVPGSNSLRMFPVQSGQVTLEYSSAGLSVGAGQAIATIAVAAATPTGALLTSNAIATVTVKLVGPSAASVVATPTSLSAIGSPQLSQIVISGLVDADGTPIPDGAKVALTAFNCSAVLPNGSCVFSTGGAILPAGTTAGDGAVATNESRFNVFTVAGGEVHAVYSTTTLTAVVNETKLARVSVVAANSAGAILSSVAIGIADINLRGTTSAEGSGPTTLAIGTGGTGAVTFSGIKDAAGNVVPDGTTVLVTARNCDTVTSTGSCNTSNGGTITGGASSPSGSSFRAFVVSNGSVTVTYSTAGATPGAARVQIAPAKPDGTLLDSHSLLGGVWSITLTP